MKVTKSIKTISRLLNMELESLQNKLERKEEAYDNHQDKMPDNPRNDSWDNRNDILEEEISELESIIEIIETFIDELEDAFDVE